MLFNHHAIFKHKTEVPMQCSWQLENNSYRLNCVNWTKTACVYCFPCMTCFSYEAMPLHLTSSCSVQMRWKLHNGPHSCSQHSATPIMWWSWQHPQFQLVPQHQSIHCPGAGQRLNWWCQSQGEIGGGPASSTCLALSILWLMQARCWCVDTLDCSIQLPIRKWSW